MTETQTLRRDAVRLKTDDPSRSASDIAIELKLTKDTVQKWLKDAGLGVKKTGFFTPVIPPLMRLKGNYLVLQDLHSYTMNKALLDLAIDRALFHGVDGCILGGDLLNLDRFGKYPSIITPASLNTEFEATDYATDRIVSALGILKLLLGNHDMRLFYRLEGDLDAKRIVGLIASPAIQPFVDVTTRNYCMLQSGGQTWMISHEFKYSKNRTAVPQALAQLHRCNVIHGHQHLIGKTLTDDGRYWAVSNGCIADQDKTAYASLMVSSMPQFQQGCTVVKDGEAIVYAYRGKKLVRL